jgi:hypothetical protein
MTYLVIAYVLVGVVVYAVSDTLTAASKLSRALIVLPFGTIQKYLALFVIGLWPLWLFVKAKTDE